MNVSERLQFLKETIIEFGNQGPPNDQSDADLFEYMHDSVAGLDWAKTAIIRAAAADSSWNIQKLFASLDSPSLLMKT